MKLPPKTPLSIGDHTKCFLELSLHFTAMSTVAILMAITVVMSLLTHATNLFSLFEF